MKLESILAKHAKNFINVEIDREAARGIMFDGEGYAYATDSFQALRVGGLPEVGFPWVQDLDGNAMDVEPDQTIQIIAGLFRTQTTWVFMANPQEFLQYAELIHVVQKEDYKLLKPKDRELYKVELFKQNGMAFLKYKGKEVTGSVEVGKAQDDFYTAVDCRKLISCLRVFKEAKKISVSLCPAGLVLKFEAPGVETALMAIRSGKGKVVTLHAD